MTARRAQKETPAPAGSGTFRELLDDAAVRAWHDERSLRSRLTADGGLKELHQVLRQTGLDPKELLEVARKDPDGLSRRLVRFAAELKRAGRTDAYLKSLFAATKSFLESRRISFKPPKVGKAKATTLVRERVPSPDELQQVLDRLSLRGRVAALFMAHAGVRPGVLGSYGGEKGLTLSDLPELEVEPDIRLATVPFQIVVPAHLSKTSVLYQTFGTPQLASALVAYLKARRENGEKLGPKSPVLAPNPSRGVARRAHENAKYGRGFVAGKTLVEEIARVMHDSAPSGVTWRPYVLRAYCSTRLLMAEGEGRITQALRYALLGHDGGSDARYNTGKAWGSEMLEDARRQYARSVEFLEPGRSLKEPDVAREAKLLMLEAVGATPKEAEELAGRSKEEVLAEIRKRLGVGGDAPQAAALTPDPRQADGPKPVDRIVTVQEAERLLGAGWAWLGSVGERVAVRGPGGVTWTS